MRTPNVRHILVSTLLVALVGMGCATSKSSAGPGSAVGNAALDYYPLFPGWGWAYNVESDGRKVLAVYSVSERRGNVAVIKNGDTLIEYLIEPDGIARREGTLLGDYLVRTPLSVGAAWPVSGGQATVVEARKTVQHPSGTYRDCAVIEEARSQPSRVTRTTYCNRTGPIEIEMRVYNPMKLDFETIVRATLLSVTRPGDAAEVE